MSRNQKNPALRCRVFLFRDRGSHHKTIKINPKLIIAVWSSSTCSDVLSVPVTSFIMPWAETVPAPNPMIVLFCVINNRCHHCVNFFRPPSQIRFREKLRQNDRPHSGNDGLAIFDVYVDLARQAESDVHVDIKEFVGKLGIAKLNNLERFTLKSFLTQRLLHVVYVQNSHTCFGYLILYVQDGLIK